MISIREAKRIREDLGMTHVVIFAVDEGGKQHVATHGKTKMQATEAAHAGNKLKSALGWSDDLCQATPLERMCRNCTYFKPDYGYPCFNGWTKDGSDGHCHYMPMRVAVAGESGCSKFEPDT